MAEFESEAPFKGGDWSKKGAKKPKGMKKKDWEDAQAQAAAAQKQEEDAQAQAAAAAGAEGSANGNGGQKQENQNKKKQGGEKLFVYVVYLTWTEWFLNLLARHSEQTHFQIHAPSCFTFTFTFNSGGNAWLGGGKKSNKGSLMADYGDDMGYGE